MNRHKNFSERIIKKYSFFRKSSRMPALVFLRLFGLRDNDRKNSVEKNASPEWRINNYSEFHFYTGVIRKPMRVPENRHQRQYNVSFYRNILQAGMTVGPVGQRSSAPQKFFLGGSAHSYPAVQRDGLFPVYYTITGLDKPTVKSTVLPARHVTGRYLQKIFNRVNTVPGYPAIAMKEPLRDKSENPDVNMPTKYEMAGKNVLFPVLTPITSSTELTLNSMDFSINNHPHITNAKDAFPKNNKTTMKIPTYKHALSERTGTGLTREEIFVKTVLKRNIFTGLILNVQKMNERLSGREQVTFPDNIVPAANPALHFASNPGKAEKPVRIEDTIDTIVRKHTDLVLRKTSGDNITNNVKKQDVMRTTNEEARERIINKSISPESKPGDLNTIADTVYKLIERRLLIEKEKRGLV